MKDSLAAQFSAIGVTVQHFFCDGLYVKTTRIPANAQLTQHKHPFDHVSWLTEGSVMLEVEGIGHHFTAPARITIPAHKVHKVTATADACWHCVWPSDVTDPEKIDESLLA